MAKNSENASDALVEFGKAASVLTTSDLNDVLSDEKLNKDFALGARLFVSAVVAKFEFQGNSTTIKLDARNSFDLRSLPSYQWVQY